MQILPVDITAVIAVIMGISIVLIPVVGLTARFALKPAVEALSRVFETRTANESIQILERRISLLESQIEGMESAMKRLDETARFDAQLRGADTAPRGELPKP
jgi:hypothetical protein